MNRRSHRKDVQTRAVVAPDESGLPDALFEPDDAEAAGDAGPGTLARWSARAVTVAKALLGVTIVAGASTGVAWGAHRYALTSPRFAIATVETEGAERLTDAQIRRQAGIGAGQNIFAVDLDNAERRLLENPWVEEAKVTRELPRGLRVELKEREAAALAAVGEQLYLLDRAGQPFKRLELGEAFELPLVTGISPENLARDRKREVMRITRALEVLRIYDRIPFSKTYPPQELHLEESGDVVLSVGKAGIALHLGDGPFRKKLLMAERVLGQLGGKGRAPGLVFLDNKAHPERVVVRLR